MAMFVYWKVHGPIMAYHSLNERAVSKRYLQEAACHTFADPSWKAISCSKSGLMRGLGTKVRGSNSN